MHLLLTATLLLPSSGVRLQTLHTRPTAGGALDGGHEVPKGPHKLAWFHPPACATSFGATLLHYANVSLPRDEGASLLKNWVLFWKRYPVRKWFGDGLWHDDCDHAAVTEDVYQEFKGHFAGLFRSPRHRITSRYIPHRGLSVSQYAARANGTVALQLTGEARGEAYIMFPDYKYCGGKFLASYEDAPPPDLELAVRRLQEGFMFVGLVEEFDLSVCLFHAMFGGECLPVEFENMRRRGANKEGLPELDNLRDADQVLYDLAAKRFWADVKAYGVHRKFCQKLCAKSHHIFRGEDASADHTVADYRERPEYDWPGRWVLDEDDDVDQ